LRTALALLAAVVGAAAYGSASVLQSVGAKRAAAASGGGVVNTARQLPYIAGLALDLVGWLLSLVALRWLPLFVVQAVLAGSLAVTVVLAAAAERTKVGGRDALAVGVTVAALAVLGASATEGPARHISTGPAVAVLAGAAVLGLIGWVSARRIDPAAAGAIAGLAFGGTAISARAVDLHGSLAHVVWQPLVGALLVFGATGLLLYATALERGEVGRVTAALWVAETTVPGAIGLLWLGDKVRAGWPVPAAVAFVLAIAAAAWLARLQPQEGSAA
jgi:hypothetical protein